MGPQPTQPNQPMKPTITARASTETLLVARVLFGHCCRRARDGGLSFSR
jgi:hypothetical protein